jgi:5-formyltetrahydrofolate cyclo-ligase
MSHRTAKQLLRKTLRLKRASLSLIEQEQKASQLANIIYSLPEFVASAQIAAYWPNDNEISPVPILQKAHLLGKQCYLPILHPSGSSPLSFVEYKPGELLTPNRFGILEPQSNRHQTIPVSALNLVLVPLVGFDEQGTRLGMGKGYYDTTFSFLKPQASKAQDNSSTTPYPYLIGLAYELQKVENLPVDPWDIALNGIATEHRYLRFKSERFKSSTDV